MKADKKRLFNDVEFLTSITPSRNYKNLEALDQAASYIFEQLSLAGCKTSYQLFKADRNTYKNVIGIIEGKSSERIIVGAHYDVCGNQAGADDNASAVAGLLETARLLQAYEGKKPPFTFEFVSYCLEEPPFFATEEMGSAVHAAYIHENQVPVKLMVCYEMIGYFSDEPNSQNFPNLALADFFPDKGNFIICAGLAKDSRKVVEFAQAMKPHGNIPVFPVATPFTDELVDLSDQRNYWSRGYFAVMINDTSFMRNPHYHLPSDTIETLDFDKMKEVVNATFGALINLC